VKLLEHSATWIPAPEARPDRSERVFNAPLVVA
jgi:hypothetical protein